MILDTSAIVAILADEPMGERCLTTLAAAVERRISAATYLETGIVLDGSRDPIVTSGLDEFLRTTGVRIEPLTETQARIARQAYKDFGKGRGHPARLNFGDCFAYALARETGEPLLFVGDDFTHTDIEPAIRRA